MPYQHRHSELLKNLMICQAAKPMALLRRVSTSDRHQRPSPLPSHAIFSPRHSAGEDRALPSSIHDPAPAPAARPTYRRLLTARKRRKRQRSSPPVASAAVFRNPGFLDSDEENLDPDWSRSAPSSPAVPRIGAVTAAHPTHPRQRVRRHWSMLWSLS